MYAVHGDRSVETTVYRTALYIASVHITFHVEMDGIATKAARLSRVCNLDVIEMSHRNTLKNLEGKNVKYLFIVY